MKIDLEDVVLRNGLQLLDDVSDLMCVVEDKTLIVKLDKLALSLSEVVEVMNEEV